MEARNVNLTQLHLHFFCQMEILHPNETKTSHVCCVCAFMKWQLLATKTLFRFVKKTKKLKSYYTLVNIIQFHTPKWVIWTHFAENIEVGTIWPTNWKLCKMIMHKLKFLLISCIPPLGVRLRNERDHSRQFAPSHQTVSIARTVLCRVTVSSSSGVPQQLSNLWILILFNQHVRP